MNDLHPADKLVGLSKGDLDPKPVKQFEKWLNQAWAARVGLADAMTLATATKEGLPSARTVMLRGFDARGFVFYTNYNSQKGRELAENPQATLIFYWPQPRGRQVRITGQVSKVSQENSENYFRGRPLESRLGAWASAQSEVIPNRKALEDRFNQLVVNYQDREVPLPPQWGGYRVSPDMIEFWQGHPNRLHDRFRYTHRPDDGWHIERLAP